MFVKITHFRIGIIATTVRRTIVLKKLQSLSLNVHITTITAEFYELSGYPIMICCVLVNFGKIRRRA